MKGSSGMGSADRYITFLTTSYHLIPAKQPPVIWKVFFESNGNLHID